MARDGYWTEHQNIDMCFQGDVEILEGAIVKDIPKLKKIVEEKNYSAVCVGSFPHAALKKFDYQLTAEHCKPSKGYTNTLYIWHRTGSASRKERESQRADKYKKWKEGSDNPLQEEYVVAMPSIGEILIMLVLFGLIIGFGTGLW